MKEKEIGSALRELRERENLSVKDVISELNKRGISISDKALYSYESGKRAASADMFLTLCEIYKCNNILEMFSDVEVDYSVPTDAEWVIIEKYRFLDPVGRNLVDHVLKVESGRIETLNHLNELFGASENSKNQESKVVKIDSEEDKSYRISDAAHRRTDLSKDELSNTARNKHDDDIMDDPNF